MAEKCFDCGEWGDDLVTVHRSMTYKKKCEKKGATSGTVEVTEEIVVNVHRDCIDFTGFIDADDFDADDEQEV